jgi:hypothetical protein
MIIASKGAAGVTGAGLATLAGGLQSHRSEFDESDYLDEDYEEEQDGIDREPEPAERGSIEPGRRGRN